MKRGRKTIFQKVLHWKFFFIVNIIIAIFIAGTLSREMLQKQETDKDIAYLQEQSNELVARNISLSEIQTAIQTESFIEREARLKLGMKKPGESVVVIKKNETDDNINELTEGNDPLNLIIDETDTFSVVSNTSKWWYYFFNKKAFEKIRTYDKRE